MSTIRLNVAAILVSIVSGTNYQKVDGLKQPNKTNDALPVFEVRRSKLKY